MATITYIPTRELLPDDTLLDGASMLSVDRLELDDTDDDTDTYWIYVDCVSGNFENYARPIRADGGRSWRVVDAVR